MTRQKIMGLHYDSWTREETLKAICDSIKCGAKHVYRSDINAASFLMSEKNPQIKKYVNDAPIINLDGMGVVFGCKILGKSAVERIAGADLFVDLLKVSAANGFSVFFLGATQAVVSATVEQAVASCPKLDVAGFHNGYFSGSEEEIVKLINQCQPDILFIGIKSPEKEAFICRWRLCLDVKFIMGVGGTFDVFSGNIRRAPVWMQALGMEWFFRFMQEPQRMWRRYLTTNSYFIAMLGIAKLRQMIDRLLK